MRDIGDAMKISTELPTNVRVRCVENTSHEFDWTITQYGRTLAEGHARTSKEAEAALTAALGKTLLGTAVVKQKRSVLKLKLRSWVERRPYLVAFIIRQGLAGVPSNEVISGAEAGERHEWQVEFDRCGKIVPPLSDHPLRTPARKVAEQVVGLIRDLGMKREALQRYAGRMYGPQFFNSSYTVADAIRDASKPEGEIALDGYGVNDDDDEEKAS